MDFWLEPTEENKELFIEAMRDFGIMEDQLKLIRELRFSEPQLFFFGEEPKRIDFLTKISGVRFDEAYPKRIVVPVEDFVVPVIYYHHLVLSKISNGRTQDKADIEELQRINIHRKNPY